MFGFFLRKKLGCLIDKKNQLRTANNGFTRDIIDSLIVIMTQRENVEGGKQISKFNCGGGRDVDRQSANKAIVVDTKV